MIKVKVFSLLIFRAENRLYKKRDTSKDYRMKKNSKGWYLRSPK